MTRYSRFIYLLSFFSKTVSPFFHVLFLSSALPIVLAESANCETSIRSREISEISNDLCLCDFDNAIKFSQDLIVAEPSNPVGFFLLGGIYQTISEDFRTDYLKDSIIEYLDSAITLADYRIENDDTNPDWFFIKGASHGYRALFRAFHGDWWRAFQDGLRCSDNLKKSLKIDSTMYDAYYALGAYHYWKTIKSKLFIWLPFVRDRREEGIAEIKKTIEFGSIASFNARQTLLRIYVNEGRFDEAALLGDSLNQVSQNDPYSLLYSAQALIACNRLEQAENKLRSLRAAWKGSRFYDPFGFYEAEYYSAQIFLKNDDRESAKKIIDKILSYKKNGRDNAYFAETVDKAEDLLAEF